MVIVRRRQWQLNILNKQFCHPNKRRKEEKTRDRKRGKEGKKEEKTEKESKEGRTRSERRGTSAALLV